MKALPLQDPKSLLRLIAVLPLALALSLGVHPATVDAAAPTEGKPSHAKPTIVLVHGAWADGSSWSKVTAQLQAKGYDVRVPPNPLRSLVGDADYVSAYLSTIPGPIVLAGHSYGGAVITNAATGNPNIEALVYIDAFAPDEGELVVGLAGEGSALGAPPEEVFDFVPYPGAPEGDADLYLKKDVFLDSFMQDVPARRAAVMWAAQKPIPFSALATLSGPAAWETIPSWYLIGNQDLIITPAAQRAMAERAGSHIKTVNSGHVPMVSRPARVTSIILDAVWATN